MGVRTSDFSQVDTNETTFAIKSPEDRVVKDKGRHYGWPVHENNIYMRFQNLKKVELEKLWEKLKAEGKVSDTVKQSGDAEDAQPHNFFALMDEDELISIWPKVQEVKRELEELAESVSNSAIYSLNFGPQHPAAHGVLRYFFTIPLGIVKTHVEYGNIVD